MWWAGSRPIEIYCGAGSLGLRSPDEPSKWFELDGSEPIGLVLGRQLGRARAAGRPARVWFSVSMARPFMVPGDCGARNEDEAAAVANVLAAEATGLLGALEVWIGPWRAAQPCVGVAVAAGLLGEVKSACDRAGSRLVSARPWWNLALEAADDSAKSSGCDGVRWFLVEPDGMATGTSVAGTPMALEFVGPMPHDPMWLHARQRALVTPDVAGAVWQAEAVLGPEADGEMPIGNWRASIQRLRASAN